MQKFKLVLTGNALTQSEDLADVLDVIDAFYDASVEKFEDSEIDTYYQFTGTTAENGYVFDFFIDIEDADDAHEIMSTLFAANSVDGVQAVFS